MKKRSFRWQYTRKKRNSKAKKREDKMRKLYEIEADIEKIIEIGADRYVDGEMTIEEKSNEC